MALLRSGVNPHRKTVPASSKERIWQAKFWRDQDVAEGSGRSGDWQTANSSTILRAMLIELPDVPEPPADGPGPQACVSHELIAGDLRRGLIVIADHASNALPPGYGSLGLPASEFERHIAYDIGVAPVARGLCERLGVPAVLGGFSRLLIDPNRGLDDPTLIMQLSDGAVVPGNVGLSPSERERRIALYYRPYHQAISRLIDGALAAGHAPAILSIHSFTPAWKGVPRPWHAGVLWKRDARFAEPLIEALKREPHLVVGENEPYSGGLEGDTLEVHATRRGLADGLIEIRQDLIAHATGVGEWIDRLARILPGILEALAAKPVSAQRETALE
jgi:predicted N-formylglutamate amidohydrolase